MSEAVRKIGLRSRARQITLASVLAALTLGFSLESARLFLSEIWGASGNPRLWKLAATLDQDDATAWYRLGTSAEFSAEPALSLSNLENAAQANPHSDDIWLALADARETAGDLPAARVAFEEAQRAHPISPQVAWRYGNFLLRRNDLAGALAKFHGALESDASLSWNVLSECKSAGLLPAQVLTSAIPPDANTYFSAIGYYMSQRDFPSAIAAWNQLLHLNQSFRLSQALPLVDNLIFHDRAEEAEAVWRQALAATHWPVSLASDGSVVFNGGFENALAGGGFDWQIDPTPGTAFSFDSAKFHSGRKSFRVSFDGSANLDLRTPQQFVAVEPGRLYEFSAWLRTEGISTDSGLRFEILDRGTGKRGLTADLTGTHPWTPLATEFCTGRNTHLLLIALRRFPSEKFDNKLQGIAWVDDVSLVLRAPCNSIQGAR